MYINVHSSIIKSQKLEIAQISFNRYIEKNMAYPYCGMYSAIKRNKLEVHASVDESQQHYTK